MKIHYNIIELFLISVSDHEKGAGELNAINVPLSRYSILEHRKI